MSDATTAGPGDGAHRPSGCAVPDRRGGGRGRGRAAVLIAALTAATALVAVPGWVRGTGTTPAAGALTITVAGSAAAPGVPAAALVLGACLGAVALVGRRGRWLVVAGMAVAGAVVVVSGVAVLTDPVAAVASAVARRTGVGPTGATVTVWPVLAVLVGLVDAVAGWCVARAEWPAPGRRHEVSAPATGTAPGDDEAATWDALSRGEDPG